MIPGASEVCGHEEGNLTPMKSFAVPCANLQTKLFLALG